jgi:hypothetical protein
VTVSLTFACENNSIDQGKRRILKWFHILVLALIAVEIFFIGLWRIKITTDSRISSRTNLFGLKLALVTVKNLLNVKVVRNTIF